VKRGSRRFGLRLKIETSVSAKKNEVTHYRLSLPPSVGR